MAQRLLPRPAGGQEHFLQLALAPIVVVTLSGRVNSAADVARAIGLAMPHDGVREVISRLQFVRPVADVSKGGPR